MKSRRRKRRTNQWIPRVDIKEEADRFVILADVPGVDPTAIEMQMDKNVLSIKGERATEATKENEKVTRTERTYGQFYRRFALPESADAEGITAAGKHGVLRDRDPEETRDHAAPHRRRTVRSFQVKAARG